jgi:hypothetical protein
MSFSRSFLLSLPSLDRLDPLVISALPLEIRQELAEQYKQRAALLESEQQRQKELNQREELLKKQKQKKRSDKFNARDRSKTEFTLTQWKARGNKQDKQENERKKRRLELNEILLSSGSESEKDNEEKHELTNDAEQEEHSLLSSSSTVCLAACERFDDFSFSLLTWLNSFTFSSRFSFSPPFHCLSEVFKPEFAFISSFLQGEIQRNNVETVEKTLQSMRFAIIVRWCTKKWKDENHEEFAWELKDSSEFSCWSSLFNALLEDANQALMSNYGAEFDIEPIETHEIMEGRIVNKRKKNK